MPVFLIKEILHFSRRVPIVLQNVNGPCPLLGIVNVLLLENRMRLPTASIGSGFIEDHVLLECVANTLMDAHVKDTASEQQSALNEVIDRLSSLLQGMDLNIRFLGPSLFEFTENISFFDMLGVKLYHGWICDPSKEEEYSVLSKLSYNEALNKLVAETSEDGKHEASVVIHFLENDGAAQFTFYGLVKLMAVVPERSLSVLYRNNHFSVMFKKDGALYTLVSDSGYAEHANIVWETLDYESITGNSNFCPPFVTPAHSEGSVLLQQQSGAVSDVLPNENSLPIVFDPPGADSSSSWDSQPRRSTQKTPVENRDCSRPSCTVV